MTWSRAREPAELLPGQIHLWLVNIHDLPTHAGGNGPDGYLNEREIQRAARILDETKRELYVGGRAGLRILLGEYLGKGDVQFVYGPRGKPAVSLEDSRGRLEFNYSVSNGHALYAFAWNREVGVDLEIGQRQISTALFARRILSDAEKTVWNGVPEPARDQAMLRCWTRKEAYGKLLGVGIRYNMNAVDLFTDEGGGAWCNVVKGLFDDADYTGPRQVCGIQAELPLGGAATLMYAPDNPDNIEPGRQPAVRPEFVARHYL